MKYNTPRKLILSNSEEVSTTMTAYPRNFSQLAVMERLECLCLNTRRSINRIIIKSSWSLWRKWMNIQTGLINWFILRRLTRYFLVLMIRLSKSGKWNLKSQRNSKFIIRFIQWIFIMIMFEKWAIANRLVGCFLLVMTGDWLFLTWTNKKLFLNTKTTNRSNQFLETITMESTVIKD